VASQINAVRKETVENLNKIFTEVQRDITSISKSVAPKPKKLPKVRVGNVMNSFLYLPSSIVII